MPSTGIVNFEDAAVQAIEVYATERLKIGNPNSAANLAIEGDMFISGDIVQNGIIISGGSSAFDNTQTLRLTNEVTALNAESNIVVGGNVTALYYRGDGGLLSNISGGGGSSSLWTSGTDSLYYRSNVEVGIGNLFVDTTTSNVGIGSTTPSYTLDVDGDINFTGNLYQNGVVFGSTTLISPVAFAFVDTINSGSGTGISWGNWDNSNNTLDFTFDTAQSDTNYSVITDSETFDDFFVEITNKTTTGFRAGFYDDTNSRTPSGFSPFTFIIYASTPTIEVKSGGGGTGIDTTKTLALSNVTTGLTVSSNVVVGGNVTALYYIGDGSNLTGVSTSSLNTANTINFSNAITGITVDSNAVVGGNVTAQYFTGDGSNITSVHASTLDTTNTVNFSNVTTGITVDSNVVVVGNVTAQYFTGDGSNLTDVPSSLNNITETGVNLGISNPVPGYTLDVGGDINFSGSLLQNGIVYGGGGGGGTSLWTAVGNDIYYTTGNVGIKTMTPTNSLDVVGDIGLTGTLLGNSQTAASLQTARLIGGVSFNGTSDINLPGVNTTGNQDTSGNSATATALETARTITLSGDASGSVSFDGTSDVIINTTVSGSGGIALTDLSVGTEATASGDGGISYDNSTGVFTYTPPTLAGIGGTTDNVSEGSTNLYYTDARVDTHLNTSVATTNQVLSWSGTDYAWVAQSSGIALTDLSIGTEATASGNGGISYDNTTGIFTYTPPTLAGIGGTTDNVSEGSTNLYYTDARVDTHLNTSTATTNQVLSWSGTDYAWVDQSSGGGSLWTATGNDIYYTTGRVGVGTATPGYNLDVPGTARVGTLTTTNSRVAIGLRAGSTSQQSDSVAIGIDAGTSNQTTTAVAIGVSAGYLNQSYGAVAIGTAGMFTQGSRAIAIGSSAGLTSQGSDAIAIGSYAGNSNQHNNSIVLNATGVNLNTAQASSFYVKPVRGGNFAASALAYTDTGEVVEETNMHFTTSGYVGIGVVSPTYELQVSGNIYASYDVTAFSDMRFKENIKRIENPLDSICVLNGYTYNKKGGDKRSMGVIAQEILEVFPEVVHGSEEEGYSVAYGNMAGAFIEAIKELKDKILTLENEIKELKK